MCSGKEEREKANERLMLEIKVIYEKSRKTYGSPGITAALRAKGFR